MKLCAVVKADAYGHGAEEVVASLSNIADCFAVSLYSEAISIRAVACGKEILILTPPTCEEEILACARNGFSITVPDLHTAKLVVKTIRTYHVCVQVHLKGNVGMNRYGSNASWLGRICRYLQQENGVHVCGFYSHLYTTEKQSAMRARACFLQMQKVVLRYYQNAICHLSATYASMLGKEFAFDMVRIGLGLYGYFPKSDVNALPLQKAMRVYAPVMLSRKYSFGGAGYGEERVNIQKGDYLHVLRFGYADGFFRKKENGANGCQSCVNTLCMDANVRKGKAKKNEWICVMQDAEETAKIAKTIPYEILCAIVKRAERTYDYE